MSYTYEQILKMKNDCYRVIRENLGEEHLKVFKYYKGDLLPFINTKVRKDMTCGDIDCIQWDFDKKILRFIEGKRTSERNKESQGKLFRFLSEIVIPGYTFNVYKEIGDPPFTNSKIINIKTGKERTFKQNELINFLNMLPLERQKEKLKVIGHRICPICGHQIEEYEDGSVNLPCKCGWSP